MFQVGQTVMVNPTLLAQWRSLYGNLYADRMSQIGIIDKIVPEGQFTYYEVLFGSSSSAFRESQLIAVADPNDMMKALVYSK